MSVQIGSNQITGITTSVSSTDAASKSYVDNYYPAPLPDNYPNQFLTTNGTNASWSSIGGYVEYDVAGNYTFNVPNSASELLIEATGAGGGGGSGSSDGSSYLPATAWIQRTSGFGTSQIGGLTYANNIYVAGGVGGVLNTSTDTITWTIRTSGFGTSQIGGLTYANNIYVAGGVGGVLNTSTDTITWIQRTSGFGTSQVSSIIYANNIYVAGGVGGVLNTSTDTITWIQRTSGFGTSTIAALNFGNNLYVVAGFSSSGTAPPLATSTDTITWIQRTSGQSNAIYSLTYGNGIYLAGGDAGKLTASTDAITWTSRTSGSEILSPTNFIFSLLFDGNNYLYGAGRGGTGLSSVLAFSTDSITWSFRTSGFGSTAILSLTYGNNFYVAGGNGGVLTTSPATASGFSGGGGGGGASASWKISKSHITGSTINLSVGAGGTSNTAGAATTVSWTGPLGTYALTANGGDAGSSTSTFGFPAGGTGGTLPLGNTNYLSASSGTSGGNGSISEQVVISGTNATSVFQATGGGGGRISQGTGSVGGAGGTINYYGNTYTNNFAAVNGLASQKISGLSYGAGGSGGGVQSSGAVVWTLRTSGFGTNMIRNLTYANNIYVAGGNLGILNVSTDAINWSQRTSGFGSSVIYTISYGNNLYFAGSAAGIIKISTDAITWISRTSGFENTRDRFVIERFTDIITQSLYANNLWIISTGEQYRNSRLAVSTDTITWTLRTTGFTTGYPNNDRLFDYQPSITKLIYNNSTYFASTYTGEIYSSTDAIAWTQTPYVTPRYSGDAAIYDMIYAGGQYVLCGDNSIMATSTDALSWTQRTSRPSSQTFCLTYGNGLYVAGGNVAVLMTSTDAITWTSRTSGRALIIRLFYQNNYFYGADQTGGLVVSPDSALTGSGASGVKGGGGGGGAFDSTTLATGTGGTGGDGYVRISWW